MSASVASLHLKMPVSYLAPNSWSWWRSEDAVLWSVRSWGALVVEVASAYLSSSLPFVWELIVGVAFVAVIVVLPGGLFGSLRDASTAIRRRLAAAPARAASPVTLATLERAAVSSRPLTMSWSRPMVSPSILAV